VYAAHGCTLSLPAWTANIGLGATAIRFDPYADLERQCGRAVDRDAIRAARRARYAALVAEQTILPGVRDYLEDARRHGLACAVASSADAAWVTGHLERLGIDGHFGCVRCTDHVVRAKPHPELYLAVLDVLDVRANEAIAFEDSPHGIAAAKAADLFCVAVPNALTAPLGLDAADLRLASLADLPLPDLLRKVELARATATPVTR
jgi:HAD superfamily hydrolase (TIGR01509 family)